LIDPKKNLFILKRALKSPIILDFSQTSFFAKFSCQLTCQKCCGYTYYLPSEIQRLTNRIKTKLRQSNNEMYEIITNNGRCIFYNPENEFYCSIHNLRPLRCRIYPYFPVIVDHKIIITIEPALNMKKIKNTSNLSKQCPGIGKEENSLAKTIELCISFLERLKDTSKLLATIILDGETFNNIRNDRWFIEQLNVE